MTIQRLLCRIKRHIQLATPQPQATSDDTLSHFFIQCKTQGIHFVFPPTMDTGQLGALIPPPEDTKALLETHLAPMSTFRFGPYEVFTAMKHKVPPTFPCQWCERCAPGLFKHYGHAVAEMGWCSQCHQEGECLDVALIEYYRKHGIDDDTIHRELPKIRWRSADDSLTYLSLEDIENTYQPVFEASRQHTDTVA